MSTDSLDLFADANASAVPSDDPLAHEVDALIELIESANHEYYVLANPTLSDAEYDALLRRLRKIEAQRPDLARPDSPTRRVGASVARTPFGKVTHVAPMLSLGNAFSSEELDAWLAREGRGAPGGTLFPVFAELKIDGLSLELLYVNGRLQRAATRGDGKVGEDVTANAATIRSIPHTLTESARFPVPARVAVRGEVYLPRSGFQSMNEQIVAQGGTPFRNPRNAASGSLRQKDPAVTAGRPLEFFAYAIVPDERSNGRIMTQADLMQALAAWGFDVCSPHALCTTSEELHAFVDHVHQIRHSLDFDIDGVVVKANRFSVQTALGTVGREPRWALARKWPAEAAETRLLDIQVQVGRTGRLTPVAVLEPVEVGGVVIQHASLHNARYIEAKGIRLGDRVRVSRAGEVIPQILDVVVDVRTGAETAWTFPTTCPSCREPVHRPVERIVQGVPRYAADMFCENVACPAQLVRRIEHFASRTALDIRGLGSEVAQLLVNSHGLVRSLVDLFTLRKEDLLALDGFADVSAEALLNSIKSTLRHPPHRLLYGLGIRRVGERTAESLLQHFGSLTALRDASVEAIQSIEGIGPAIATSVHEWFSHPQNRNLIARLEAIGFRMEADRPQLAPVATVAGKTFVITGTLSRPRSEVVAMIASAGGKVVGSVSSKTDFLVTGENAGSKLTKAQGFGIRVISEAELAELLAG